MQIYPRPLRISGMKAWQSFAIGIAVLVAALLLPSYEAILAGLAAVAMVGFVILGFLFTPHRTTFYLRTTLTISEPDCALAIEHDRLAIRVELVRLWLLFVPTFAAIAFLVVTAAKGTTWDFSVLNRFWEIRWYPEFLMMRLFLVLVIGILSTWVSERWVLRDAEACSADSTSMKTGGLLYSFKDRHGEYYGGEGFLFDLVRSPRLARIVFYRPSNPQINKIAMACLFHRPVIMGRGVTDLDEETVTSRAVDVLPASQQL